MVIIVLGSDLIKEGKCKTEIWTRNEALRQNPEKQKVFVEKQKKKCGISMLYPPSYMAVEDGQAPNGWGEKWRQIIYGSTEGWCTFHGRREQKIKS